MRMHQVVKPKCQAQEISYVEYLKHRDGRDQGRKARFEPGWDSKGFSEVPVTWIHMVNRKKDPQNKIHMVNSFTTEFEKMRPTEVRRVCLNLDKYIYIYG